MKKIIFALSVPAAITLLLILSGTSKSNTFSVFPNPNFEIRPFCNTSGKESSTIHVFSQNSKKIIFSFSLNKQSDTPYAGINFSKNTAFDLSSYDKVKISTSSSESNNLKIVLYSFVPGITEQSKPMSYAYFTKEIPVSAGIGEYELKLSEFQIPDWWYKLNNLDLYDKRVSHNFSAINRLTIENGNMTEGEISDTIIIENITFSGYNKTLFFSLVIIAAICIILPFLLKNKFFQSSKIKNTGSAPHHAKITINENNSSDSDIIADYLGNHFTEPDFSINKTSEKTGIPSFKISRIMKDNFARTFPQYVTEIRIDEAKRLLSESDMKIIEIAFLAGFGNISHFNKVFAKKEKISPK